MADSKAHTLVLSHFLLQTSKAEEQTMTAQELRKSFDGQIRFANDFDCYAL
ncbi:hypothetical protein RCJ22_26785 [Vibrio sp. FNV 38]|nr:hypothetical protein [Vibrio sp. FNV 38]